MSGIILSLIASSSGTSNVFLTDANISSSGSTVQRVSFQLGTDKTAYQIVNSNPYTLFTWLKSGLVGDYEVNVTNGGDSTTGSALGTWLSLSAAQTWTLTASTYSEPKTANLSVAIRDKATQTIQDTCNITLYAERF